MLSHSISCCGLPASHCTQMLQAWQALAASGLGRKYCRSSLQVVLPLLDVTNDEAFELCCFECGGFESL